MATQGSASANVAPDYAVPALDKALDILELLAEQSGGLSQGEIATAVDRTASQIFRVLQRLERRAWIARDRQSGLYLLSTRMFDLASRQPPLRGLIMTAMGPMRQLSDRVRQSCNLSVLDADRVRVIAQVESPADFGFRVRVGAEFSVDTPAGQVLSEGAPDGYLRQADSAQPSIIDLVVPIHGTGFGSDESSSAAPAASAALTIPYIATSYSELDVEAVLGHLVSTGELISARLQGGE